MPTPSAPREKLLFVVSAASELALKKGKRHATGYFLGELFEPWTILAPHFDIEVATPGGKTPTVDRDSLRDMYWPGAKKAERTEALALVESSPLIRQPLALESLNEARLQSYAGVFFPGGHGPMADLSANPHVARVLAHFHDAGKPTGLVCHAPVALLALRDTKPWPYAGYRMTVFSSFEERFAELLFLKGRVPFDPETELRALGARIENKKYLLPRSGAHAVVDRELVTGQNPYSGGVIGEALLKLLLARTGTTQSRDPSPSSQAGAK